jgi:hypothetical protein
MKIACNACGAIVELPEKVGFRDTCPSCDSWLHACVNCRFLTQGGCTEPAAEKVRDPEGQNFCEWFQNREQGEGRREEGGNRDEAEEMWKKLTKSKKEE